MCSKGSESPTAEELRLNEDVLPEEPPAKEKRKRRHKEKRKRSCSTDSTSSGSSHKRHKKKKKKKRDEDPPSPKVNPIFLWVKQDHTKIVEVLCEDYDKRNRIRLTKTPAGWVAIPRTARLCPMAAKEEAARKEAPPPAEVVEEEMEEDDDDVKVIEVEKEEPIVIELDSSDDEEVNKDGECTEEKCCPDSNVDENHNNEIERPVECNDYCSVEEEHDEDIEELGDKDESKEVNCTNTHQENCENLLNELADMCFVDNFKEEEEDQCLEDIYTFVPSSPEIEKEEIKSYVPVHDIKKPPTPEPVPINLVVHADREPVDTKVLKEEPLKQSELESLEILWRLPEGTTISHSRPMPMVDTKPLVLDQPCTTTPRPQPTFILPVQEEPLNLGKPKPKEEEKKEDSKLMELLQTQDDRPPSTALDQLKEVLSDPDLSVPDPLLVPRGRLQALIANPAKEIPRLLAQKREIKYPKIDADLMVVSLSHLQSILQRGGEEDLKPYGQHMMNLNPEMDPATLNQMLWLPYLSQLELKQNHEIMSMLYPHYMYQQQYTPAPRYPAYPRPPWPRAETSKPCLPPVAAPKEQPKQKLRLKVKDHLIDPNFKRTSLLNMDPPPFLQPVGVPPNSNLWHPLFSRNARLEMRRFSPKSARTASTRVAGTGRHQ